MSVDKTWCFKCGIMYVLLLLLQVGRQVGTLHFVCQRSVHRGCHKHALDFLSVEKMHPGNILEVDVGKTSRDMEYHVLQVLVSLYII